MVTILSPCYNVASFLPQYFESVLNQTYRDLQVVLIDDGSKDDTWKVMQAYASMDSRVEIYHQENQGVASTRNNLLDKVEGEYVLFIDSDDWIELDMVESLVSLANEYHSDFVMCDRVINHTKPRITPQCIHKLSQEEAIHDFLRHEYFVGSLCNKLLGSSLLHNVRFHCGISYGEDALFCWGVLQNTENVVVTDRQLYHYRMNENSLSHSTYGPRRMSAHLTWKKLSEEAVGLWPEYKDIAIANYAISDMWQIFDACRSSYSFDENLKEYQLNLRLHLSLILKSDLINKKKKLFACVAAYCYRACGFFVR